jgi:hypothetical protein
MIILTHNGVEESECSTKSQERTVLLISLRLGLRRHFVSVSSSSYDEDIDRKFLRNPNLKEITVLSELSHVPSCQH